MFAVLNCFHAFVRRYPEPAIFYLRNPRLVMFLMKNWKLSERQLFRLAWAWISMNGLRLFDKKPLYEISAHRVSHYEFRYYFRWLFRNYTAEVVPLRPDQVALLQSQPSVVVVEHGQGELALYAAMDLSNLRSSVMMWGDFKRQDIEFYRFNTPPKVVLKGANSFLEARSALKAGATLFSYVDHSGEDAPIVTTSIFKFREAVKAQLLFARVDVGPQGEMHSVFLRSSANDHALSIEETMQEFRSFARSDERHPADIRVRIC